MVFSIDVRFELTAFGAINDSVEHLGPMADYVVKINNDDGPQPTVVSATAFGGVGEGRDEEGRGAARELGADWDTFKSIWGREEGEDYRAQIE